TRRVCACRAESTAISSLKKQTARVSPEPPDPLPRGDFRSPNNPGATPGKGLTLMSYPASVSLVNPQFLADLGITNCRVERISSARGRVLVEHEGHILAVSFHAKTPHRGTAVAAKLKLAIKELRGAA